LRAAVIYSTRKPPATASSTAKATAGPARAGSLRHDARAETLHRSEWLPRLADTLALFKEKCSGERIVLRLSRNIQAGCGTPSTASARWGYYFFLKHAVPEAGARWFFWKSGLRFEADVLRGQKTGFFLDQRENRRRGGNPGTRPAGAEAFSFFPAGSRFTRAGGATGSNGPGHQRARAGRRPTATFALNQNFPGWPRVITAPHRAIAFDWLAASAAKFDLVVLESAVARQARHGARGALRAYERLATLALPACLRRNFGGGFVFRTRSGGGNSLKSSGARRRSREENSRN